MVIKTLNPDSAPNAKTLLQVTLVRPLRLLFTEPIVMMVAFMGSVTCALFYVSAESLLLVFEAYGWSPQTASLSFIPIALGCLCGFFTRLYDHRKLANRTKDGKTLEPEDKLFGFAIAAPSLAIGKTSPSPTPRKANKRSGLWVFAWMTPPATNVHWIVPMLSLVLVGYALNENVYTLTGYLADSYTIYAASGFAGLILARASTSAVILPFARPMYVNLGYNRATSILAAIATAFCVAPFVFFRYGKRIREVSKFAKYSLTTYQYNQVENDLNVTK
ncbi:hypothetical protein LTR28_004356 [Elasticomyces elasticus]|nr:hypothetical protein LTR28_004356 [Elasticomyces elasticus]